MAWWGNDQWSINGRTHPESCANWASPRFLRNNVLMCKLSYFILATMLRDHCSLAAQCANVTKRSSSFYMLKALRGHQACCGKATLINFWELNASEIHCDDIDDLIRRLSDLDSISNQLLDDTTILCKVKTLLDRLFEYMCTRVQRVHVSSSLSQGFESNTL